MLEFTPRAAQPAPTLGAYALEAGTVGVGGFFVSIPGLDAPVFLRGSWEAYRFFSVEEYKFVIILHLNRALYLVVPEKMCFSKVHGSFTEYENRPDEMVFYDPNYPLVGETPDRVRVTSELGSLERDMGHVDAIPQFLPMEMEPLVRASIYPRRGR